jgi:hypothetical protein
MSRVAHQILKQHLWFSVYIDGVEIVDGRVFLDFLLGFHRELQTDYYFKNPP